MVSEAVDNSCEVLLARLREARTETDALFRIVKPDALYDRPIAERHRIVFYIGHLEAFDRNMLSDPSSTPAEFDRLFAFGIDPVDGNLPSDVPGDWPRLETVYQYRDKTRAYVDNLLATMAKDAAPDFELKLNVAIEHRLMHAETLAYIFHQMPYDRKQCRPVAASTATHIAPESVVIPAGSVTMGLRRDSGTFGWDNEFEELTVHVPRFAIDKHKVTNGQFLQFLQTGGYSDKSLWNPADWEWRTTNNISHPAFWVQRGDKWTYKGMFEELALPLDQPAYTSHAEATAYAHWAGQVLPTEAQWQRAAFSVHALEGAIGTGWEWTSTEFAPFPGFHSEPFYPGYSEPFFDGKHYVLKGGSPATAPVMLRPSFRNWFQPHYQYVYAGFRCAEKGA